MRLTDDSTMDLFAARANLRMHCQQVTVGGRSRTVEIILRRAAYAPETKKAILSAARFTDELALAAVISQYKPSPL